MVRERSQHQAGLTRPSPVVQPVSLRLDNGVWVLGLPTPAPAPGYRGVASVQLWVAAGSAGERKREHGCAHLLEHMVFKPHEGAGGEPRDGFGQIDPRQNEADQKAPLAELLV